MNRTDRTLRKAKRQLAKILDEDGDDMELCLVVAIEQLSGVLQAILRARKEKREGR